MPKIYMLLKNGNVKIKNVSKKATTDISFLYPISSKMYPLISRETPLTTDPKLVINVMISS